MRAKLWATSSWCGHKASPTSASANTPMSVRARASVCRVTEVMGMQAGEEVGRRAHFTRLVVDVAAHLGQVIAHELDARLGPCPRPHRWRVDRREPVRFDREFSNQLPRAWVPPPRRPGSVLQG